MPRELSEIDYRRFISTLLELDNKSVQFTAARAKIGKLVQIHPLVAHSLSMSRSALHLIEKGDDFAAMALSRCAFEHSIYAQYVHLHSNGVEHLRAKVYSDYRLKFEAALGVYEISDEIRENFKNIPSLNRPQEFGSFKNLCNQFSESKHLYAIYCFMSAPIHPGNAMASVYIHYKDDESALPDAFLGRASLDSNLSVYHTLLVSLLFAQFVYEDLRKSKPYMHIIKKCSVESGVPFQLTPKLAPYP